MKASATWVDGMLFVGEGGSGHAIVMDAAPDIGGRNLGLRPMELLLIGMAGCTGIDVVNILKRGREPIARCTVEVEATRAATDPKVFTALHVTYRLAGRGLSRAKVERAVALSKEKYCSASIMLGQVATLTHSIEVHDDTTAAA